MLALLLQTPGSGASSRVSMVVAALVGLAIVIAIVTVVFWYLTRPEPSSPRRRSGRSTN